MISQEIRHALPLRLRQKLRTELVAEHSRYQGLGYMWGREDAGDTNTGSASAFAQLWGELMRLHHTEEITGGRGSIQRTYDQWRRDGFILVTMTASGGIYALYSPDEYTAPRLVPVPWTSDYLPW